MDRLRRKAAKTLTFTSTAEDLELDRRKSTKQQKVRNEMKRPEEEEVDRMFEKMLTTMGFDEAKRSSMLPLPQENKWAMIQSQAAVSQPADTASNTTSPRKAGAVAERTSPEWFIEQLTRLGEVNKELLTSLRISLTNLPISWVQAFISIGGFKAMLDVLESAVTESTKDQSNEYEIIRCIKAFMNNKHGLLHALTKRSMLLLTVSLSSPMSATRKHVAELLTGVCYTDAPRGFKLVMAAMEQYRRTHHEERRFENWMKGFSTEIHRVVGKTGNMAEKEVTDCIMANLLLVNALIEHAADIDYRMHVRNELFSSGFDEMITDITVLENPWLNVQLNHFISEWDNDWFTFSDYFHNVLTKEETDVMEICRTLHESVVDTPGETWFLSIWQSLLGIRAAPEVRSAYFKLISRIIDTMILDRKGIDPDFTQIYQHSIADLVATYRSDSDENMEPKIVSPAIVAPEDRSEAQPQVAANTLQPIFDNLDRAVRLTLGTLRNTLAGEYENMQAILADLETMPNVAPITVVQTVTQPEVKQESAPETKVESVASKDLNTVEVNREIAVIPPAPPPPPPSLLSVSSISSDIPPPPPLPTSTISSQPGDAPPPPPPPPPMLGVPAKPNVPDLPTLPSFTPTVKLRQFQWDKIPNEMVSSTIWSKITKDISTVSPVLEADLKAIEKNFHAMKHRRPSKVPENEASVNEPIESHSKAAETLLDAKRAHNLTIMLGRNKHSFIELREALVKMDETIMTPQTVKRFLDYIPTPQEIQLLGPYSGKSDKLAKADCFFLEMSKIDHYEERLLGLNLKFNAEERLRDIEVDVKTVFTAALTIRKSQKFAKLLGLILMMGNYMNGSGHKGGAYGFGISSLNRLIDTKTSTGQSNLLHHAYAIASRKDPDIHKFVKEFDLLSAACRVNFDTLDADVREIRKDLQRLQKECDRQQNKSDMTKEDKFLSVMLPFSRTMSQRYDVLEKHYQAMKEEYESLVKYFGEKPVSNPPETFFGIFHSFAMSYQRVMEEDIERRAREEAAARRQAAEEQRTRLRESQRTLNLPDISEAGGDQKGVMDSLLESLKKGGPLEKQSRHLDRKKRGAALTNQSVDDDIGNQALLLLEEISNTKSI